MNETIIKTKILEFLKKKGYPENELKSGTFNYESLEVSYLSLNFSFKRDARLIIYVWNNLVLREWLRRNAIFGYDHDLNSNTQSYLFTQSGEEFKIERITLLGEFVNVEQFPLFSDLKFSVLEHEIEKQKFKQDRASTKLENRSKRSYFSAIGAALAGCSIMLSIALSFFYSMSPKEPAPSIKMSVHTYDSLIVFSKKIEKRLTNLERKTNQVRLDSVNTLQYVLKNEDLLKFEARLKIIEDQINNSPEETLSLVNLKNDVKSLNQSINSVKEIVEIQNQNAQTSIGRVEFWGGGLAIGIFILLISQAFVKAAEVKSNSPSDK